MPQAHVSSKSHTMRDPTQAGAGFFGPGAARGMATLGLLVGLLGVLCWPYEGIELIKGDSQSIFTTGSGQSLWMAICAIFGSGMSILLMGISMAALSLKRWSRMALIGFAIISLVLSAIGFYPFLGWLGVWGPPPVSQRGVSALTALAGWIIGTVYSILLLIIMTRPEVKDAFRREEELP